MSGPTVMRHEVQGRAYLIYFNGTLVNILGCLTEHEVAQLEQESATAPPLARTSHHGNHE